MYAYELINQKTMMHTYLYTQQITIIISTITTTAASNPPTDPPIMRPIGLLESSSFAGNLVVAKKNNI